MVEKKKIHKEATYFVCFLDYFDRLPVGREVSGSFLRFRFNQMVFIKPSFKLIIGSAMALFETTLSVT